MTDKNACLLAKTVVAREGGGRSSGTSGRGGYAGGPGNAFTLKLSDLETLGDQRLYNLMQPSEQSGLVQPGPFCCVMGMLKNIGREDCLRMFAEKFPNENGGTVAEVEAPPPIGGSGTPNANQGILSLIEAMTGVHYGPQGPAAEHASDRRSAKTAKPFEQGIFKSGNITDLEEMLLKEGRGNVMAARFREAGGHSASRVDPSGDGISSYAELDPTT
eukprot:GSA25T00020852001.1